MKFQEVMRRLKAAGTAQNVKVYKRHGAGNNLFGVSFAELNKLKKEIKIDHDLAQSLWETGNTDAQTLATMIADPAQFTVSSADAWLRDIYYALLAGMLGGVVAKSPIALGRIKKWTKIKKEMTRAAGYGTLASWLKDDANQVPDDLCRDFVGTIEDEIHSSANQARHAMNTALIAIGIYKPKLRRSVIATAKRIGKVEVDHGETSCKTPDAVVYIERAAAREK